VAIATPPPKLVQLSVVDGEQPAAANDALLVIENLSAWYGRRQVVADVDLIVPSKSVTALIGPSGCGKSTLLRCINRMHELVPGARVSGDIRFDGHNLYDSRLNAAAVRLAIGMVFQRPNPFPTMSIYNNVAVGVRLQHGRQNKAHLDDIVEGALRQAHLWDEVKNRLHESSSRLSGGQQQRLCIARGLAPQPSLLLMDEPCSALDPVSTAAIETLIRELSNDYAVIIVTHNLQQAARVSDHTGFMTIEEEGQPGRLVEFASTAKIFADPDLEATEAYVNGRVG
jgi:phosphate transport system ATP-binding protein